jgi:ABC-type multidrug transport system fused ATPase/permease subunit
VLYALWKCIPYVSAITGKKTVIDNSMPSLEQILTTIKDAKNLKQTSGSKTFTNFHESILLYNVSFEYPERGPVLKGITVRIPKGRMIGIVGESGSGKSTLIDVVMGFNQPSIGQVTVDGTPLPDYDIVSYRQRLGYVPQDPILFNTSIRENLLWAKPDATQEEIVEACNRANATEFIDALPEGYETMIGDRGVRLSGGQCQRLALARAILRKPELLILDEATSSLDTASERLIQQAIDTVAQETTVIAVAHRLSTLSHSDYIYVIHEGEVVEEGSPKDLLGKNGAYAKMVYMQSTAAQDS